MTEVAKLANGESRRVADSRARAQERLDRQRGLLRPLGLAFLAAVVVGVINDQPAPAAQGRGLGVSLAAIAFVVLFAVAIGDRFVRTSDVLQAGVIVVMGGAGVALAALQPDGAAELAGVVAVWMAVGRLEFAPGVAIGAGLAAALAAVVGVSSRSASTVLAATLLCALMALVARFMRQARESQDRTELLLAQLEDAREEQTRAAAVAERGRIAGELHDILAHSLSAAAIQLQGARILAEREQAGQTMRGAIERASELVRDGLASAKQAVGALRGDAMPGVAQLPQLVDGYRDDLHLDVRLLVEGTARDLPVEASLALYRAVQEALTNVARYAPQTASTVVLCYRDGSTRITVENGGAEPPPQGGGATELANVGGGRGLAGLRERVERVRGSVSAGPTETGWRVVAEVPA